MRRIGSALGTTLALAPAAMAQNVIYNGPGPYTLTRTDTISGGPRTVDITSTDGDITLDLTTVNALNDGTARGAGIAATETGAGKVSIRSGTVTSTGTGPTTAIDARSTTGAILVNSGTVSATSTSSTALQASSSAGGAVTINANSTTGGLRGIFTSFSGGVTTITSNFATSNGVNTPNAINIAGGSLTVVQNTNTVFAGSIVGAGTFIKSGSGLLNFTGSSTYAGPTTVNGGTLAVNGSIVLPVIVAAGGTLGGGGSVGSVTINSGGFIAPGNSIGTLTVNGNVTYQPGSTFLVEANAAGQADRVNATGTASLQGGTVAVTPMAGAYANLTNYTILTAAGGVTGTFAGVTSADTTLSPFLAYGANAVTLTLARNNVAFGAMGVTGNQSSVGRAITTLGVNSGIYRALLPLSAAGVSGALGQLSGEIYASLPAVLADGSKQVREAVLARATTPGEGFGLWATGTRTLAGSRNQLGLAPVISNRWTAIGRVDFTLSGLRIGIDGGYIEDETRVRRLGSHAKTQTKLAGGHVGYAQGPLSLVVGGDYAWHDIRADRALGVAGLAGATTVDTNAHTVQGYAETGYGVTTGTLTVMPFARFSYVHIVSDAFSEAGGVGALAAARDTRNYKFGSVGLRMMGDAPIGGSVTFQPRLSIAYTRGWDVDGGRTLAFAGTSPLFTATGTALGKDALDVNAGFDLAVARRFTIGVGGFGSTSRDWSDYGAKASVGLKF